MAWDVVIVGGANTDFLVRGPRLPRAGETARGEVFLESPGGKGANQAIAAARLGAKVALVARVGRDMRGSAIVARLDSEGVDITHVHRDPHAPTGVALVQVDEKGEKQILAAPEANLRLRPADVWRASDWISSARVLLLQLEIPMDAVRAAAELGHAAGVKVILDPSPISPLADDLFPLLAVIRPDAIEAEAITGVRIGGRDDARRAAERLLTRGVGAAAIAAPGGNLIYWREGELWLPHIPVESVDETGAGDALVAALAVALSEGWAWDEAGAFASAAAALASTGIGAQGALPGREAVMELLAREARRSEELRAAAERASILPFPRHEQR